MRNTIALLLISLGMASGQATQTTPEQRQAILNYQLTLPRVSQLMATGAAIKKLSESEYKGKLLNSAKANPAGGLAAIENDPKMAAIFKENGLTAREYVVGTGVLSMALMVVNGVNSEAIIASPANVAFAKANLAQIMQMMAGQANGRSTSK